MKMNIKMSFLLFVLLFFTPYIYACDCGSSTIEEKIQRADLIVIGIVKSITDVEESCFNGDCLTISIEIELKRMVKGRVQKDIIFVNTMKNTASCGYPFVKNEAYLIFLKKEKNKEIYFSSLCSGTTLL